MATEDPLAAPAPALEDAHTVETLIRERLSSALGGARGSFETALPTVAFVVAWVWTQDVNIAVGASVAIVLALLLVRLVTHQTPRYVLSAILATAIAAFFALRSGKAEAAFLPGILMSAGWGVATLISVLNIILSLALRYIPSTSPPPHPRSQDNKQAHQTTTPRTQSNGHANSCFGPHPFTLPRLLSPSPPPRPRTPTSLIGG
ncbi:MAG: DUF3159 domain-containing protein [Dermatophilaceae bacterium]|nr:DUF3159 domain-containing protein [Dermatophilaceae bacterium]